LNRYRRTLIQERTREANRLQKVLEEAHVKLASVATDVLGVSGRAMLAALLGGQTDGQALAALARGRWRARMPALRRALDGRLIEHHRLLIQHILDHIDFLDFLDERMGQLTAQIEQRLRPYQEAAERLQAMPGVGAAAAATIIAEIGTDMTRFPSA
jgi:transposase